ASRQAGRAMAPVLARHPARLVLTPANAQAGTSLAAGGLRVDVVSARPHLEVRVGRLPPGTGGGRR
ncbi:MAG: hypothetical protein M3N68_04185, partial [Actinomycetota bacterium]|nr:hypothetical protein [Actinomycetota bacterium]